jgi:hypothetical protein
MSEKSSEAKMRDLIAAVAGPVQLSDNRKSVLSRAARNSGLTFRQVKALFYGEITDPYHRAARKLKDAAVQAGRKEARSLAAQFETIAGGLNARDEDFHREDVAALIGAARLLRGLDRTGT